jgi:hypothetical protein
VTLTGHLREDVGTNPQPLLSITSTANGPLGENPALPTFDGNVNNPIELLPIDVMANASVLIDGEVIPLTPAGISCSGSFPCSDPETLTINPDLVAEPLTSGLHLLQVQNPSGPLSNELPVCVNPITACQL